MALPNLPSDELGELRAERDPGAGLADELAWAWCYCIGPWRESTSRPPASERCHELGAPGCKYQPGDVGAPAGVIQEAWPARPIGARCCDLVGGHADQAPGELMEAHGK